MLRMDIRRVLIPTIALALWAAYSPAQDSNPATRPARSETSGKPTLFIVGDSTVKNGSKTEMGWGDAIGALFDGTKIEIQNRARAGRSSRTYQTEGLWDRVLADAKPGDFVMIQMGHNDAGPIDDAARARGSLRGTGEESREIDNPITKTKEVVHTYGWYMRKYVADAKARGVTPIILSPVPRCPKEKVQAGSAEKNDYVTWAGDVAKGEGVTFVNLNRVVMSHYAAMSPEEIKSRYFTPADNTHTSRAGAELNAACVVEGLRELGNSPLAPYLPSLQK